MVFDATKVEPLWEVPQPAPPVTREDAEYYIMDLPPESGAVIRRYITQLERELASVRDAHDRLDRARYKPGDGDTGG
jgi:hypothetical protein